MAAPESVRHTDKAAEKTRKQQASGDTGSVRAADSGSELQQKHQAGVAVTEGAQCQEAKDAYHRCFDRWYTQSFLKGELQQPCQEEWQVYRRCVQKRLELLNLRGKLSNADGGSGAAL